MVGPRAPMGKLTDHLKGLLGGRPAEGSAPKPSLSDLRNGGKSNTFDDSDMESSSSDSDSSDSDSDGDNKSSFLRKISATHTSASPAKPKTNGAVSAAKPASKVPEKTNGTTTKKVSAKSETSTTSTSSSEDDSDSSESEKEEKKKDAKKPAHNNKKAAKAASPSESSSSEDSSSAESSSESDVEEKEAPKEKAAKSKPAAKAVSVSSSTSSSSSEPASSKSSRESSVASSKPEETEEVPVANGVDSDEEMADQSFAIVTRENGESQVTDSASQFATQGFQLRRADESNDASDVARLFRQAKLEGKQLWYFTAPASVPITVVEQMAIPVAKAEQGKAILSHEGQDYGMSFDDALTARTIKVLIPNKAGDKYSTLDRKIDKTMHLKRVTRFAMEEDEASAQLAVQAPVSTKKPPRKQPEGLRARFLPIGVNDSVATSKKRKHSDDAPPAKAVPTAVDRDDESDGGAAVKTSKKKKDADVVAEPSLKKAKKDKKSASVVPLPTIPGFTATAPPAHKVTPVAPPVLPPSALKASAAPASEKSSINNILPSSQISYSQIDTPSKIFVDDKPVKKSKEKKLKKQEPEADEDAMDIDEETPKKHKKDKKDKSEKKDKKDKKEKKEKKERKSKHDDDAQATPVASLAASAAQPKKVTPVPLPRML